MDQQQQSWTQDEDKLLRLIETEESWDCVVQNFGERSKTNQSLMAMQHRVMDYKWDTSRHCGFGVTFCLYLVMVSTVDQEETLLCRGSFPSRWGIQAERESEPTWYAPYHLSASRRNRQDSVPSS